MTVKANHINIYPSKSPVNASPTQSSFSQTLRALTHGNSLWQNDTKRNQQRGKAHGEKPEKARSKLPEPSPDGITQDMPELNRSEPRQNNIIVNPK